MSAGLCNAGDVQASLTSLVVRGQLVVLDHRCRACYRYIDLLQIRSYDFVIRTEYKSPGITGFFLNHNGGAMLSRLVSGDDAAYLLDMTSLEGFNEPAAFGSLTPVKQGPKGPRYRVTDVIIFKLAQAIGQVGVSSGKAMRYAEAILIPRLTKHDKTSMEWIENETQELFCLIADGELSRIFLRNREDDKELDVGAVKPVLLPTVVSEINVFRVIRPVIRKARHLLGN